MERLNRKFAWKLYCIFTIGKDKLIGNQMPIAKSVNLKELAKQTDKFSGAMIEGACQKAGLMAIRERKENKKIEVTKEMFEKAIKETQKK